MSTLFITDVNTMRRVAGCLRFRFFHAACALNILDNKEKK